MQERFLVAVGRNAIHSRKTAKEGIMNIEYSHIVITVLSTIAMWACFRLIERHGNTPRANSYMTLSQIAAGEGSGFFRFLVLRISPPLVVLIGEAAILAKWKSSVSQQLVCLSISALLYVFLTYVPSLIRGFTFGERFLSLTLIFAYPALALAIGAITQYFDFSKLAPSNFQAIVDSIWQTLIAAIIIITFYEFLRNCPEEKYNEQFELYDRKSQLVIRDFRYISDRFGKTVNRVCSEYQTSKTLLFSILVYENLNRPQWIRHIENILVRLPGAKLTVGIAQVTSTFPLSDVESIELAAEQLRYTYSATEANTIKSIRCYNPSDKYVASVLEIKGILAENGLFDQLQN